MPRPERNQLAIIFIAGGYTPPSSIPVKKRIKIAEAAPCANNASDALQIAAAIAQIARKYRELIMSDRFSTALNNVPVTKPNCTERVSHAAVDSLRFHSFDRTGTTADALNHKLIANKVPAARMHIAFQGEGEFMGNYFTLAFRFRYSNFGFAEKIGGDLTIAQTRVA
jgi:hypothetical protein